MIIKLVEVARVIASDISSISQEQLTDPVLIYAGSRIQEGKSADPKTAENRQPRGYHKIVNSSVIEQPRQLFCNNELFGNLHKGNVGISEPLSHVFSSF